jgi:hypothetical protein
LTKIAIFSTVQYNLNDRHLGFFRHCRGHQRIINPFMISCRYIKSKLHAFPPKMLISEKNGVFGELLKGVG